MMESIEPATTLEQAIKTIEDTADFYHSMISDTSPYWWHNYWASLDLLERIQGLPEDSLMQKHDLVCDCAVNN